VYRDEVEEEELKEEELEVEVEEEVVRGAEALHSTSLATPTLPERTATRAGGPPVVVEGWKERREKYKSFFFSSFFL
jgi:hypothetical protein